MQYNIRGHPAIISHFKREEEVHRVTGGRGWVNLVVTSRLKYENNVGRHFWSAALMKFIKKSVVYSGSIISIFSFFRSATD